MFIVKPLSLYKNQNEKIFNKNSLLEVKSKLYNESELNNKLNLIYLREILDKNY